jgi:RNA polymerase sigma-70 factor (ECF subfamily)
VQRDEVDDLFRRYSAGVFRRARTILGDSDSAKDATQEVFLRAMNSRIEFAVAASPIAWLYRVTTNLCLTRLRDSARRQLILSRSLAASMSPSTEPTVDAALTVQRLLRDVPEALQEIAVFYFVDRMSQDEIAEIVGIPRRTVGYRIEQFRSRALGGPPPKELAS